MPDNKKPLGLAWEKYTDGLMPVIVQESGSGEILMQAYANEQALAETRQTGDATFWSRSRNALWRKGATSGDMLTIDRIRTDCDLDAIIYEVRMQGAQACHVPGQKSCFHLDIDLKTGEIGELQRPASTWSRVLTDEAQMIASKREADPGSSSTAKALASPIDRVGQKVGEEGVEVAIAVSLEKEESVITEEVADLLYQVQIALERLGIPWDKIEEEIVRRRHWHIERGKIVPNKQVVDLGDVSVT